MEKLFTWVWRLNGLLILAACLGVLALVLFLFLEELLRDPRPPVVAEITQVAGVEVVQEGLKLGSFERIDNTPFLKAELGTPHTARGSTTKIYDITNASNILFVNMDTSASHWLFPDNSQIIETHRTIWNADGCRRWADNNDECFDLGLLLGVSSTNQDTDTMNLLFVDSIGKNSALIKEEVNSLLGSYRNSTGKLVVLFETNGVGRILKFDLTSRQTLSERNL